MNPWGLLYECLHSALIDVLNREFAGIQPELGLPQSGSAWTHPAGCELSQCGAHLTHSALIHPSGARSEALSCLIHEGAAPESLWKEVLAVATAEFESRSRRHPNLSGISAFFEASTVLPRFPDWPMERPPSRLVWTPVRVDHGKAGSLQLFLGLALPR